MKTTLSDADLAPSLARLEAANLAFLRAYPGEPEGRQPVHTIYGGAHLFRADTAKRIGELALKSLDEHAPDFVTLARALQLPGAATLPTSLADIASLDAALERDERAVRAASPPAWLAWNIRRRVVAKLRREAVEDFRLDYEDGYGARPDPEEDGHAVSGAREVAKGLAAGTLPPFIGLRVKPLTEELRRRSLRTLDLFVTALVDATGGKLPPNFVVTLPKIQVPEQASTLADVLERLEPKLGLPSGSLKMEMMVELTQSLFGPSGELMLPRILEACRGRCVAAHFGTYDYTASCGITAAHQRMSHPACDFARHVMQVCFARTGLMLSDGATNVMPIGPHRTTDGGPPLTPSQIAENRAVVHGAWKVAYDHIRDSLLRGFYQGWDLHPAQVPIRYAAMYAFFLEGLDAASERLRNFVDKAAQATLVGDVFDDAATAQGLLNYFLRAMACGALTEEEATRLSGLSLEELRGRSFVKILAGRKAR